MNTLRKLIAVIGPTASGKSSLAIALAQRFGGAILSADSRQIYRGMDIGSGKVPTEQVRIPAFGGKPVLTSGGIAHFGIDIADPKEQYSIALYKEYANKALDHINQAALLPIICGGTGHWIDTVIYNESLPAIPGNQEIRNQLDKKSTGELYTELTQLDPERAKNIDHHNRRRLIRALEINVLSGKPVPQVTRSSTYDVLWIGVDVDKEQLQENIKSRLKARLDAGMITEVAHLHASGVSWNRLEEFGLEYKFCSLFLQNKLNESELFQQLFTAIKQYAKRQMTWFKRNEKIHWVKNESEAIAETIQFLKK